MHIQHSNILATFCLTLTALACGPDGVRTTAEHSSDFAPREAWQLRYASDDGSFTSDGLLITDYEGACKGLREGKYFQSSKSVTVRLRERSEFEGYPYWGIAPPVEGSYPLLTDVEPPPSQTHLGLGQFVSVGPACNPRLELPSSGELTVEKLTGTGAGQRVMGHLRMVLPEDGTIDVDFEVDTCDLTPGVPFVQSCADRP